MVHFSAFGGHLGGFKGYFGTLGGAIACIWGFLGVYCVKTGYSRLFFASWVFMPPFGRFWLIWGGVILAILGVFGGYFGYFWGIWRLFWLFLGYLEVILAIFGVFGGFIVILVYFR